MGHFANIDYKAIANQNSKNLDRTPNAGKVDYVQSIDVVVIGAGHSDATMTWLHDNHMRYFSGQGEITVTKGKGTDPGTLSVSGLLAAAQPNFKKEIGRISNKKIVFV